MRVSRSLKFIFLLVSSSTSFEPPVSVDLIDRDGDDLSLDRVDCSTVWTLSLQKIATAASSLPSLLKPGCFECFVNYNIAMRGLLSALFYLEKHTNYFQLWGHKQYLFHSIFVSFDTRTCLGVPRSRSTDLLSGVNTMRG